MFSMRADTVFWAPNSTRLLARAISQGPTKLEISSANPPTTSPRKYLSASKTLHTGPYKSLVHRWFYEHEKAVTSWRPGGQKLPKN